MLLSWPLIASQKIQIMGDGSVRKLAFIHAGPAYDILTVKSSRISLNFTGPNKNTKNFNKD